MCELFVKEQFLNSCSKDLAANYGAMSAEHLVTEHQIVLKGEVEEQRLCFYSMRSVRPLCQRLQWL